MKKLVLIIGIFYISVLSCKEPHTTKLPNTNINKFINGNIITFPVETSTWELYDVLYYVSPNSNSLAVKNGTLGINKIVYSHTIKNDEHNYDIYFNENSNLIKHYNGYWLEHSEGISGVAQWTDIEISFTLE